MTALSSKLRSISDAYGSRGIAHFCPGCEGVHVIWFERAGEAQGAPCWSYDGNARSPTCWPSVRIFDREGTDCHYFLKAGQIEFCGDCRHSLSGKTVPLPDWPYPKGEYGGIDE